MKSCVIIPTVVELYVTPRDESGTEIIGEGGVRENFSCKNYTIAQVESEAVVTLTTAHLLHIFYTDPLLDCMKVLFVRSIDCRDCNAASGMYEHNMGMKCSGAILPPGEYRVSIPEQSFIKLCGQEPKEMQAEIVLEPVSSDFIAAYKCGG